MELLDLILGNYDKDSPEVRFSKIIAEGYQEKFNPDEFDSSFDGVAHYKPIKTNMGMIARNYIDTYDINEGDKDYVYGKFLEAYDEINDKSTVNVQAIIDGLIDELEFDSDDDDDNDTDDAFDDDDIDYDSDDDDD